MVKEGNVIEEADWFGTTGLDEQTEGDLPIYIRMELGKFLEDDNALQAKDLSYLGKFSLNPNDFQSFNGLFDITATYVHIWKIGKAKEYVYVEILANGDQSMFLGSYLPQQAKI